MKLSNRALHAMLPAALAILPIVLSGVPSAADAREHQVTRTNLNDTAAERTPITRTTTTTGPRGTRSTYATLTRTDNGAIREVIHTGVDGRQTHVSSSIVKTDAGAVKNKSITGPDGKTTTVNATTVRTESGFQRDVIKTGPNGNSTTSHTDAIIDRQAGTDNRTITITGANGKTTTKEVSRAWTPAKGKRPERNTPDVTAPAE